MVAVALEQKAALAGGARGVEAGDRPVRLVQDLKIGVDRKPALVVHEHAPDQFQAR